MSYLRSQRCWRRLRLFRTPYQLGIPSLRSSPKKPLKTNPRVHTFASRPTPNPREIQVSCVNCQQPHLLRKCPQFIDSSIDRRLEIVLGAKCCLICFSPTHETVRCRWFGCQRCQQKHHRMLCRLQKALAEAEFFRPPLKHFPAPQ